MLREIGAAKNIEFRRRMLGRKLSVITLDDGGLSDNFLRIELSPARPPNQLIDVEIGAVTPGGLREATPLRIL